MTYQKIRMCSLFACAILLFSVANCRSQAYEANGDHSCTINAAGELVWPAVGKDANNFNRGWGIQLGGGFAVTRPVETPHGLRLYLTANYMYNRLEATGSALSTATMSMGSPVANATSGDGGFMAVTFDPTVRGRLTDRTSWYLSGGFGYFRRNVSFNNASPGTLLQSNSLTLDRFASNSGVVDFGAGLNFGLKGARGAMVYLEGRVYRGLTVNSGKTLVPLSFGFRL